MNSWNIFRTIITFFCLTLTGLTIWAGEYDEAAVWALLAIFWRIDLAVDK